MYFPMYPCMIKIGIYTDFWACKLKMCGWETEKVGADTSRIESVAQKVLTNLLWYRMDLDSLREKFIKLNALFYIGEGSWSLRNGSAAVDVGRRRRWSS